MNAETIIRKIGGGVLREAARRLDLPVKTLHHWKMKDRIPHWREEHIRKVAKEMGVDLDDRIAT